MTDINPALNPSYEARERDGVWDITMRIPHVSGNGGATVEQILIVAENCGVAPTEESIAHRVAGLLNKATHIGTNELCIKGATLQLKTFSEIVEASASDLSDREKDMRDTNEAPARSLRMIATAFGYKLSANSDMLAESVIQHYNQLKATIEEPAPAIEYTNLRVENAKLKKTIAEYDEQLRAIGTTLWATSHDPADILRLLPDALESYSTDAKEHTRLVRDLGAIWCAGNNPDLRAIATSVANQLSSYQSRNSEIQPFKLEIMRMFDITKTEGLMPSFPDLMNVIRERVEALKDFNTRALVLHDNICHLIGDEADRVERVVPFSILFERLETAYRDPIDRIHSLSANFELDVKSGYRDAIAEIYHYLKGLSIAQHKSDQNTQTLLSERTADRAIIGAIDDLCSDALNRPAVPVMAAVRALVKSPIEALARK